jgi:Ca-activated chloride channel family protein
MQVGEQITEKIISHEHLPNRVLEQNQHLALKASLLPQLPPNVFTSHLANIAPYSEVTVTIFYRQLIEQNNHKFQFRLPLISKQAYSPLVNSPDKSIEFDDNKDIKTAGAEDLDTTNLAILPAKTSIKVRLNAGLPLNQIKSKHHPIKMTKLFETQYDIELDTLQPANKDFILLWQWRLGDHIQASHFKAKTKIDVLINNKYINKNSTLDLIT